MISKHMKIQWRYNPPPPSITVGEKHSKIRLLHLSKWWKCLQVIRIANNVKVPEGCV